MSQSISDRRELDPDLDRAMRQIEWEDEHRCWPNVGPAWGELIASVIWLGWKWIVFALVMLCVAGVIVGAPS